MYDIIIAADYLINPNIFGGIDRFFYQLSEKLRVEGYQFIFLFPNRNHANHDHYIQNNVPCLLLEGNHFMKSVIAFTNKNPSKVIHTHFFPTFARQYKYLSKNNKVIIVTEHMSRPIQGWSIKKQMTSKINKLISYRYIDHIIHVSKYLENENRFFFGNNILTKSKIIYNGVAIKPLNKNYKQKVAIDNKIQLISVGRLVKEKGMSTVLKVFEHLCNQYGEKFELNILGDGYQRKELECEAGVRLNESIFLRGNVNNVSDWLRKADVYVHCASQEAFAFIFLEAAEAGLPIITLDVGGNREFIIDGFNGFLIHDLSNLLEFENKIVYFMNNIDQIKNMGQNSRELVKNSFSDVKMIENYIDIYKKYL